MHTRPSIEISPVPIVVGSGIAGLSAALNLGRCLVVTKGTIGSGASDLAQGGIAAAEDAGDDPGAHAADTIAVGGGLVDEYVATIVTGDAPSRIAWLRDMGANFDRDAAGSLRLGKEAGHSHNRIVHADGDGTGHEVMRALRAAIHDHPDIEVLERATVVDLVRSEGGVVGVVVDAGDGTPYLLLGPAVVLATGGIGRVFARTTNPAESTGDGLAVAARAGATLADVEFVQFHPTALDGPEDPLPLLTEALRGAGATLIDASGRRFMVPVHPAAELAPRDIVARAVWEETTRGGAFLDATCVGTGFPDRFPTVFTSARAAGLDPRREPLPVTPAAHYHMGGIVTDIAGRTSLPGLYACGEVAATGLHGANRLASNSLLEGLVFGSRVADAVRLEAARRPGAELEVPLPDAGRGNPTEAIDELRDVMWRHVGVVRERAGLVAALGAIERLRPALRASVTGRNLATVANLVAARALARNESRGSHFRADFPRAGNLGRATVTPPAAAAERIHRPSRIRAGAA